MCTIHIAKGDTKNFSDYVVFQTFPANLPQNWWQKHVTGEQPTINFEKTLEGVVEADDTTGLLVCQMFDERNQTIYTNGVEEIALDNPVKLLLLNPNIRQAFHASGFRPKLSRLYVKGLKIVYHGPIQTTVVKAEVPEVVEVK